MTASGFLTFTFILIHGSWHGAWSWHEVQSHLERWGHRVEIVDLPAHGIDGRQANEVTLEDYVVTVAGHLKEDEKVILVGHSMGGIVLSAVAEAYPEKVDKLIYIAATLLPDGLSLFDYSTMDKDSLVLPNLIIDQDAGEIRINLDSIGDVFYSTSGSDKVNLARVLLRPEPIAPLITPLSLGENYESVRRFYIKTLMDRAVTPYLQEIMLDAMPCEDVYSMYTDHSPFFSQPAILAAHLIYIAIKP